MWDQHNIGLLVVNILADVPLNNPDGHHFGRPYMSAYQLAIELERRYPDAYQAIGKDVGGTGAGQSTLAQYLALQLSRQIRDRGVQHPVEGAFLTNVDVIDFRFRRDNGDEVRSSLTGTGFDLSMFRLRIQTEA